MVNAVGFQEKRSLFHNRSKELQSKFRLEGLSKGCIKAASTARVAKHVSIPSHLLK